MALCHGKEGLALTELADHFDLESMDMLREVMDDEFPELIRVYIDDSSARLPEIHSALGAGDTVRLRELAHTFKGASSNISAASLAKLCYDLELAAKENRRDELADLVALVEREYAAVESLLRGMI